MLAYNTALALLEVIVELTSARTKQ